MLHFPRNLKTKEGKILMKTPSTGPDRKHVSLPDKYKLFLMLLPFLLLVFVFSYLPLYGWRS